MKCPSNICNGTMRMKITDTSIDGLDERDQCFVCTKCGLIQALDKSFIIISVPCAEFSYKESNVSKQWTKESRIKQMKGEFENV